MKTLIAIAALTAANIASAAPQTIYFAGNVYNGVIGNSATQKWDPVTGDGSFFGSITFDATKGTQESYGGAPYSTVVARATYEKGNDAIVSGFTFNFRNATYSELPAPSSVDLKRSSISWYISDFQLNGDQQWIPLNGVYVVGTSTNAQTISNMSNVEHVSKLSRALNVSLQGDADFVGNIFDLASLPNLDEFDPTKSLISFTNSSYTCAYRLVNCQTQASLDDGGVSVSGRLTYLSTTPLQASELPEPSSLALVALGIVGLAGFRRKSAQRSVT